MDVGRTKGELLQEDRTETMAQTGVAVEVKSMSIFKKCHGASLVAQWLRICLPMQGTRVRALVWEDPTCHGATRPVSHSY